MLNIPYDDYSQVGMFPIAYTKGVDFKPGTTPRPRTRDALEWLVAVRRERNARLPGPHLLLYSRIAARVSCACDVQLPRSRR